MRNGFYQEDKLLKLKMGVNYNNLAMLSVCSAVNFLCNAVAAMQLVLATSSAANPTSFL
jgi:hypothetical protein